MSDWFSDLKQFLHADSNFWLLKFDWAFLNWCLGVFRLNLFVFAEEKELRVMNGNFLYVVKIALKLFLLGQDEFLLLLVDLLHNDQGAWVVEVSILIGLVVVFESPTLFLCWFLFLLAGGPLLDALFDVLTSRKAMARRFVRFRIGLYGSDCFVLV